MRKSNNIGENISPLELLWTNHSNLPQLNSNSSAIKLVHEIRNPLTTIKGVLQLLKADLTQQSKIDYVDIAVEEIDRVSLLLNQLLLGDQASQDIQQKEMVSLNHLVTSLFKLFENEAKTKGIKFTLLLYEDDPLVYIYKHQIKQVLINLIKNAIEAIEENGKSNGVVQIATEAYKQSIFIHVIDNGNGMTNAIKDNLFKPFYSTKRTGTGLGLSICQDIIHHHSGRMMVSTEVNKGTKFSIELPLHA